MNRHQHTLTGSRAAMALAMVCAGGASAFPEIALAQASASPYTTGYRYDANRRLTGTINPDPDGAGVIKYAAVRISYDPAGRTTKVETGELLSWQDESVKPLLWSGFNVLQVIDAVYDTAGRKIKEVVGSGGTPYRVTQYSYDSSGRLECTAIRMNAAVFGALPVSACTMGAPGTQGPDRITKNVYDAASQLLQIRKAVGTSAPNLEQAYVTYAYSDNGKQRFVVDANGNKAEYIYDGFDRLSRWNFPSLTVASSYNPSTPATALSTSGAVNASDYEEYGYDPNGNRTSFRKREGLSLTYAYDALNRMTVKTVPERSSPPFPVALNPVHTRDVYYEYDLRGLQTKARFDSLSGEGVTNEYDGFGQLKKTTANMAGYSRILEYEYDANGNRTSIKHPDTQKFNYTFDGMDRMNSGNENGTTSLFYTGYDNQGRPNIMYRMSGDNSQFAYDGVSRLSSLSDFFVGSTGNVVSTFTHNPASQIVTRARNNDAYAYLGNVNVSRAYTKNGLNQYTAAGAATFGYDANGNLTSDGASTYVYDVENRLVSATGATTASLLYDPLGRLFQVSGGAAGTTQFLYDGDKLVAEYSGTNTMLRRYVHRDGDDTPIIWYEGAGFTQPRGLYVDHQGSITGISSSTGTLSSINSYDEYGIPASTNVGRFQYTGQPWIPELGMYHYKSRIYSPTIGRFLQVDPVGYDDQINLYAYVGNDPINMHDPSGKQAAQAGARALSCVSKPACRSTVRAAIGSVVRGIVSLVTGDKGRKGETFYKGLSNRDIASIEKTGAILPKDPSAKTTPDGHIMGGVDSKFVTITRDFGVARKYATEGPDAGGYVITIDGRFLPGIIDTQMGEGLTNDIAKDLARRDEEVLTGFVPGNSITSVTPVLPNDIERVYPRQIVNCMVTKFC